MTKPSIASKILVEDRAATKRLAEALRALQACTETERRVLFRKLSLCTCVTLGKAALDNPAAAIGAFFGGVLAEALVPPKKKAMGGVPIVSRDVIESITREFDSKQDDGDGSGGDEGSK